MRNTLVLLLLVTALTACKTSSVPLGVIEPKQELKIAFGSCNKHDLDNLFWDDILNLNPDIWI